MKAYNTRREFDLCEESLVKTLNESKKYRIHREFEADMAFAPKHKFFPTLKDSIDNAKKRMEFLKVLDRVATTSGVFQLTDAFCADFLERND